MKSIGLIPNLDKKRAVRVAKWLVNWLGARNVEVWMEYEAAKATEWPDRGCSFEQLLERSEIIVVLGGDGTLLNAARTIAPSGTPVFGINLGHLGFLTEIEVPEIVDAFAKILAGEYHIEERMLLESRVIRRTKEEHRFVAFNDVVIAKSGLARIIQLQTYIDGKYVDTYSADGLIIASPTGSTAYSLSAGGPIVSPYVDSLIITPICPHTLYARSLIISSNESVQVVVKSLHTDMTLTGDGQHDFALKSDDKIEIKKAKHAAKLVKLREKDFYRLLRTRLKRSVD